MTEQEHPTRRRVLQATGALAGASVVGVLGLGAVMAEGGDLIWEFQTGSSVVSSPTVVDGTVFVGSVDESVYALDAGIEGLSEGSRARLGTPGHHVMGESFRPSNEDGDGASDDGSEDGVDETENGGGSGDVSDDGGDETGPSDGIPPSDDGSSDDGNDGFGPGFGVGGALAGVGGASYLLKRRFENNEGEED